MEIIETRIEGLCIVNHRVFNDDRGLFIKTYNSTTFKKLDIDLTIVERYFSVSKKNVIRGMHFQSPPYEHIKLVNVLHGSITDVVVDLRENSNTFGEVFTIDLKANDGKTIYIPKGLAHGFKSLEDNTIVEYNQTTEYAMNYDQGILFNSIGFDWKIDNPIISDRDLNFPTFNQLKTYF